MKWAKFLLAVLVTVLVVLAVATTLIWGLGRDWGLNRSNNELRNYSPEERQEIISSVSADKPLLFRFNPETGENEFSSVGKEVFDAVNEETLEEYSEEERNEILRFSNK